MKLRNTNRKLKAYDKKLFYKSSFIYFAFIFLVRITITSS